MPTAMGAHYSGASRGGCINGTTMGSGGQPKVGPSMTPGSSGTHRSQGTSSATWLWATSLARMQLRPPGHSQRS